VREAINTLDRIPHSLPLQGEGWGGGRHLRQLYSRAQRRGPAVQGRRGCHRLFPMLPVGAPVIERGGFRYWRFVEITAPWGAQCAICVVLANEQEGRRAASDT